MSTVAPPGQEILICGAGPTGLTLACELYRHGVACRLIDKGPGPSEESRALGIHSRTLEVFEDMGCLEPILESGLPMHGVNVHADGKRIVHLTFDELDAPHPFVLMLPQSDTERLLIEHLRSLGGQVEWNTELVRFGQDEDRVGVTLQVGDREEDYYCGWLIGCDGAHSVVRKGLRLEFGGSAYPEAFLLADVRLEGSLPRDEASVFFSAEGPLIVFPLPGEERVRVMAMLPEGNHDEPATVEFFLRAFEERAGLQVGLGSPTWMANFRIHRRMVDRYRVGQTFLCGDAAHIHSPVGGQGMNTGIQDAYNLAWKLALVAQGQAPLALLDTYAAERHPVAKQVLTDTDRATKAVTLRHPVGQAVRNTLGNVLSSFEVVQRRMTREASQIAVGYRCSPIVAETRGSVLGAAISANPESEAPSMWDWLDFGRAALPGDRAPDCELRDGRLFDLTRGPQHTLLLFDGRAATDSGYANLSDIAAAVQPYGERIRTHVVVPAAGTPGPLADCPAPVLLDPDGALHARYGAASECLYLIRPDGYVGYRAQPAELEPLLAYLQSILTTA